MILTHRRNFLKSGALLGVSAMLGNYSFARIDGDGRLKIAILGCGRSGFRAANAMMQVDKDISIIALGDVFADCAFPLRDKLCEIAKSYNSKNDKLFDVPDERVFTGLDCLRQIMQTSPDIIVFATPPVFRPMEVEAAVAAGVHIFMEKPVCVDPVQARQMYELAKISKQKKLTVISGVQRRYHAGYRESIKRLEDGQIGEITGAQCFWLLAHFDGMDLKTPPTADASELEYQLRNWALFTWTSGDHIVEQQVHNLDIMRWAFGRDPLIVTGIGGRALNLPMPQYGNRFSHFSVDYDYGNDVHIHAMCRQEPKTSPLVIERIYGTKGVFETSLFSAQKIRGQINWTAPEAPDPTPEMHRVLLKSVRENLAINTMDEMTDASMLAIAGRLSAYSGIKFKYQWAKKRSQESLWDGNLKFGKKPISPLPIPGEYKLS